MAKSDYKVKYLDIRSKYLESSDVAYRLGYADGMKDGAQQAQEQAMAEQQAMEQQQAMGGGEEGGMPLEEGGGMPPEAGMEGMGEEGMGGEEEVGPPAEGAGDDMDNHISELENLVSKGEKPKVRDLRKAVKDLVDLRKAQKANYSSKKQDKVASAQKQFVDNIIAKFDKETKSVTANLEDVIKEHGLKIE